LRINFMPSVDKGRLFLRVAARALLLSLEEIPVAGALVRIGRGCWEFIKEYQDESQQDERIAQLEQAAACSPQEAQQIAVEVIAEVQASGQVINPQLAEAVTDLIAVMPARIGERTRATLTHARRLGTKAVTVLPVTSEFSVAAQEAFYTGLFPPSRPLFRAGDTLPGDNKWQLERLLGVGGFGEVWLVQNKAMPSLKWAVKFCGDVTNAKMLKGEANRLIAIKDKLPVGTAHIVALLNLQLEVMPYWLAFEYIDGGTLESKMRLGAMAWPAAWELFQPLLQGMAHVHELEIVHRDLKPANVLLAGGTVPRIADFGIGQILADKNAATRLARTKSHVSLVEGRFKIINIH
jgi:hypothetical protein